MVLLYFLLGAGAILGVQALVNWARKNDATLRWYHWLSVAVVALWFLFVLAWIGGSLQEAYAKAATVGGLLFGGIGLVLLIAVRLLILKSARKTAVPGRAGAKA